MIITQLEGSVPSEKSGILRAAFDESLKQLPEAIDQSYLVQDTTDNNLWRVITIWKSREALQGYRQSVETPEGILMFRAAGVEPSLSISEVIRRT